MIGSRSAALVVTFASLLFAGPVFCQTVSVNSGNIVIAGVDGRSVPLTSLHLDSDPSLSTDKRLVVFVRRTQSLKIDTGRGEADRNELWIAETSGKLPPRRILVGHKGGFKTDDSLVLAGFSHPQFSLDANRVYLEAQTWATADSIRMLDLRTRRVSFLYAGLSVEVLHAGDYAGHLIALKEIPCVMTARIFRYWLLDSDGNDVGEIGDSEANVKEFKAEFNGH